MLETYQLLRNGPYLRVTLPEVLPPDWNALEADVVLELSEGVVEKATVVAPCCGPPGLTVDAVLRLADLFARHDVRVRIERREDAALLREVLTG